MKLQPVDRGDIVAACPGAYLRQTRTQYILVIEGVNNTRFWSRRKVNFAMALEKANARLEELKRPGNPLGIMCATCFRLCVLSKDGTRWLCQWGHGNDRSLYEEIPVVHFADGEQWIDLTEDRVTYEMLGSFDQNRHS